MTPDKKPLIVLHVVDGADMPFVLGPFDTVEEAQEVCGQVEIQFASMHSGDEITDEAETPWSVTVVAVESPEVILAE